MIHEVLGASHGFTVWVVAWQRKTFGRIESEGCEHQVGSVIAPVGHSTCNTNLPENNQSE